MEKREDPTWFYIILAFAVVCFWRGVWGLLDLYLLPSNSELSFWVSLILGFSILAFTKKIRHFIV